MKRFTSVLFTLFFCILGYAQSGTLIKEIYNDGSIKCFIQDEYDDASSVGSEIHYSATIVFKDVQEILKKATIFKIEIYPKLHPINNYPKGDWSLVQASPFGKIASKGAKLKTLPLSNTEKKDEPLAFDFRVEYYFEEDPFRDYNFEGSFESQYREPEFQKAENAVQETKEPIIEEPVSEEPIVEEPASKEPEIKKVESLVETGTNEINFNNKKYSVQGSYSGNSANAYTKDQNYIVMINNLSGEGEYPVNADAFTQGCTSCLSLQFSTPEPKTYVAHEGTIKVTPTEVKFSVKVKSLIDTKFGTGNMQTLIGSLKR